VLEQLALLVQLVQLVHAEQLVLVFLDWQAHQDKWVPQVYKDCLEQLAHRVFRVLRPQ
jgi:hypothetical protein